MPINSSSAVPSQRHAVANGAQDAAEQEDRQPRTLPYDDPVYVAMHLGLKMEPADYVEAARLMTARCWEKAGADASLNLLRNMLETAAERDPDSLQALLQQFTTDSAV
jgi:ParB family chromosome partitioning protein